MFIKGTQWVAVSTSALGSLSPFHPSQEHGYGRRKADSKEVSVASPCPPLPHLKAWSGCCPIYSFIKLYWPTRFQTHQQHRGAWAQWIYFLLLLNSLKIWLIYTFSGTLHKGLVGKNMFYFVSINNFAELSNNFNRYPASPEYQKYYN